jgi:hypothetical protein
LEEDYLKFSDVGEAAMLEAERENQNNIRLLKVSTIPVAVVKTVAPDIPDIRPI